MEGTAGRRLFTTRTAAIAAEGIPGRVLGSFLVAAVDGGDHKKCYCQNHTANNSVNVLTTYCCSLQLYYSRTTRGHIDWCKLGVSAHQSESYHTYV